MVFCLFVKVWAYQEGSASIGEAQVQPGAVLSERRLVGAVSYENLYILSEFKGHAEGSVEACSDSPASVGASLEVLRKVRRRGKLLR